MAISLYSALGLRESGGEVGEEEGREVGGSPGTAPSHSWYSPSHSWYSPSQSWYSLSHSTERGGRGREVGLVCDPPTHLPCRPRHSQKKPAPAAPSAEEQAQQSAISEFLEDLRELGIGETTPGQRSSDPRRILRGWGLVGSQHDPKRLPL